MPKLIPVYDNEKSLKEQNEEELKKHRKWDNIHSLTKEKKNSKHENEEEYDSDNKYHLK